MNDNNLSDKQRMLDGQWYDANAQQLVGERRRCQQICFEINRMPPEQADERNHRIASLLGKAGECLEVIAPFHCDYGYNVEVGSHFFANFNLVVLDEAKVTFGDYVFIGPNCSFYTAIHPLLPQRRNQGVERAEPICVGDNVWFGGNVTVLPGVTIGSNSVIGAGSVVTHNIPDNVVAVGNPCRVLRTIAPSDQ